MNASNPWQTLEVPKIDQLQQVLYPRSQSLLAHQKFPTHSHAWNQFVYATSGTLAVTVEQARYVITPEQAIWVPTGTPHSVAALNGVDFRNLYIPDSDHLQMPAQCTVFNVTGLMRELILELEKAYHNPANTDNLAPTVHPQKLDPYCELLSQLIITHLKRLPVLDFHLPWPKSSLLQNLCESLFNNPADKRSVNDWGNQLGASARTITRRFEKEVGMTLREWRFRLRLFLALEWLCSGRNITEIALDLGYSSPSAFTYMFRKEMGCPPSQWCR